MNDLWLLLTSDPYFPFTVTFFVLLGIGLIEAIGLGIGEFPDAHVELGLDGHTEGFSFLGWMGVGSGLPILIWLTSLLSCFTLTGFIGQQIITMFFQTPLTAEWAVGLAIVPSLILNTFVANGLARIIPREETSALNPEDLLGLRGVVVTASAFRHHPSRVKVIDRYNQAHYLPIEPHDDHDTLLAGETVLLVRRKDSLFFGQLDSHPTLRSI